MDKREEEKEKREKDKLLCNTVAVTTCHVNFSLNVILIKQTLKTKDFCLNWRMKSVLI